MYNVNNKKVIRNIAIKSFIANKTRNVVAVIAIALTALMFTSVLTIGSVIIHSFEQSNFMQVGGYAHGSVKDVSYEDIDVLREHPLIDSYGISRSIGTITDGVFAKSPAEIKYVDENYAKMAFADLIEGAMPEENTNEIICDTDVLKTLGIEPILGSEIPLTYEVYDKQITDTFILSGYFEPNNIVGVGFIYTARSYVDNLALKYPEEMDLSTFGRIDMSLLLQDDNSIEDDILKIIEDSGYVSDDETAENYLDYGVNWGYVSAQASNTFDAGTILFASILALLFMLSGYLIIFNIFKISVSNDVRFYGLLKTVGTTGKQIRRMIRIHGHLLSLIGIPIGLLFGFLLGSLLAPTVVSTLNTNVVALTINPYIFIGGALFSFVTVMFSVRKPAKIASHVAPVEAIKYTEGNLNIKGTKKTHTATAFHMAMANMKRSKGKTFIVITSLSLAILILQMSAMFTTGFSMEKYLEQFSVSDFLIGNAKYLNIDEQFNADIALSEQDITFFSSLDGVDHSGIVYGTTSIKVRDITGNNDKTITLYVMDRYALEKLNLIDGGTEDGIIALYSTDDYGKVVDNWNTKKVGDTLDLRFTTEWEYESLGDTYVVNAIEYSDEQYKISGIATMKHNMGYRSYASSEEIFILPYDLYNENLVDIAPMNVLLDVEESSVSAITDILEQYTTSISPSLDFESSKTLEEQFYSFKNMFSMVGGILSIVLGFIGILNFFNVILTSVSTRKREFAMLQSIGMTGKQLKQMLICESVSYILFTVLVSTILTILTMPLLTNTLSSMFWFYESKITIVPLLCVTPILLLIGICVPTILYKTIQRKSIVERLREIG